MKYLIASDIHGSALYLEQLLKSYTAEKADCLVLLGDILYHGPRNDLPEGYDPKQCISLLNDFPGNILAVRGNCDTEVDQMVLSFPIMADYAVISCEKRLIYLTHGHLPLPEFKNKPIVLGGHTHVPACEDRGSHFYINPGSVSLPKENSKRSYLLLENGEFANKTLDGEVVFTYKV